MTIGATAFRLDGRRILVTGASLGIGRAVALAAAAAGAALVVSARRREGLEALAAEIAAMGGSAQVLPFDSADPGAIRAAIASAGPLDGLVNNAGSVTREPFLEASEAEMDRVLGLNVKGAAIVAQEVARGLPTALVAASKDAELVDLAVDLLHSERLRVYKSSDPVGVEVGGAVKNVIAIATGIADGLALGLNARAALIARGLAEMTRLGVALGARAETFLGLAGVGDLVLTATGDLSRNRRVGLLLAAGRSLPQILQELGHVAEGVYSAATVLARAQACGVEMPITAAVVDVLEGRLAPAGAALALMGRGAGAEL